MTAEVWRDIPSLPAYQASSLGRVMCKPYKAANGRTYGGKPHFGIPHEGRPTLMYKRKNYRISRLVCEAFHGPAPFEGAVAMHADDDHTNNAEGNLQWGTQKQNLNAPKFLEHCRNRRGPDHPVLNNKRTFRGY